MTRAEELIELVDVEFYTFLKEVEENPTEENKLLKVFLLGVSIGKLSERKLAGPIIEKYQQRNEELTTAISKERRRKKITYSRRGKILAIATYMKDNPKAPQVTIAADLGLSLATVKRYWRAARVVLVVVEEVATTINTE